ncbi:MAG: OsmC family protein [Candidatus Bathyarchaeia archaeon]|nr:OsmC family protein [Candidatus Bathyarchaeota archaeon]
MAQKLRSWAKLVKDFKIVIDNGRFHSVCVDLPPELGTDKGPTALELCVMSYAGCFATIFALMAKKTRVAIKDLEVEVEAIKSDDVGTITEANLNIIVKTDASEETVQRLFKLTVDNCPVGKLFERANVKISYNIKKEQ